MKAFNIVFQYIQHHSFHFSFYTNAIQAKEHTEFFCFNSLKDKLTFEITDDLQKDLSNKGLYY